MTASAGWVAAAAAFGVAAIASAHIALVSALAPHLGLAGAAGVAALADLVLVVLLLLAARARRDPVAEEALALRRAMLTAAARSPVEDLLGVVRNSSPAPVIGAVVGEAVARWIERRG